MTRFLRYLRIAFSATCSVACLLLIALWVRSYSLGEDYEIQGNKIWFGCSDLRGSIVLTYFDATRRTDIKDGYGWGPASGQQLGGIREPFFGFAVRDLDYGTAIVLPMWFVTVLGLGCTVAPWFSWSFGLRNLLIAMTLVAIGLGLLEWLSQ